MSNLLQDMLGASDSMVGTNVDIVFVIDATGSMYPLIDKVKSLTLSFRDELEKGLKENRRKIDNLRTKVITFRDYYDNPGDAMFESRFFNLPEENKAFHDYVSDIHATGGGDEPESSLEALSLALRSDFVKDGDKKRHVIVLFTDASAHPLEKNKSGTPHNYPQNMFSSLGELYEAWGMGQESLGSASEYLNRMSRDSKRLVLFAPDLYPWCELECDLENTIRKGMNKGNGGKDLDLEDVISLISKSIA